MPTLSTDLRNRLERAAIATAKLLEPKIQRVHLTNGALTTPVNVKTWLARTESELTKRLADGPVIIS
jgi:hypothetical protein